MNSDLAAECGARCDSLDIPFRTVESLIIHRQEGPVGSHAAHSWARAAVRAATPD